MDSVSPSPRCSSWHGWNGGAAVLWKDASDFLALPLIGDLFDEVAKPKRLTDLDLREPLEWAAASLNRVDHDEFFPLPDTFDVVGESGAKLGDLDVHVDKRTTVR